MKTGDLRVFGSFNAGVWQRIHSTTLASTQTTITISNLDGNTDVEYILTCKAVNGSASNMTPVVRINGDTGTNYGYQYLYATSTSAVQGGAGSDTGLDVCLSSTAPGSHTTIFLKLHAKSGYVRTGISESIANVGSTLVTSVDNVGSCWNNTADNITSLSVVANQTGGLGIGTVVELYRRRSPS